jgi:acetyltransferase-like isoleucine patch superfamily enzyme
MSIKEIIERIRFWRSADRIGPDIAWTYWRFFFPSSMKSFCMRKFKHFGKNAEIRPGVTVVFCSNVSIGDRVVLRPGTSLFAGKNGGIVIEDGAMLGSGVHIYVVNHRFDDPSVPIIDQGHSPEEPVILKKGCWIGANAILLPGVTIGENAVVGAGSIVTKSVPARTVYAGNPARFIKEIPPRTK